MRCPNLNLAADAAAWLAALLGRCGGALLADEDLAVLLFFCIILLISPNDLREPRLPVPPVTPSFIEMAGEEAPVAGCVALRLGSGHSFRGLVCKAGDDAGGRDDALFRSLTVTTGFVG